MHPKQTTQMASRSNQRQIAKETLSILDRGWYNSPDGRRVNIGQLQSMSESGAVLYTPDQRPDLLAEAEKIANNGGRRFDLKIDVRNETTFNAARRLRENGNARVLALNFASARNVGGGFLNGASAQEEALCRASGLYPTLSNNFKYYEANRAQSSCLYTHHMIYSPDVPVFRDDKDKLVDKFFTTSVITAPAPNRGALENNEPAAIPRIGAVFLERIEMLLAIAVVNGYHRVVLGAWGCGAFRNDGNEVAEYFRTQLEDNPRFKGMFSHAAFAILDTSKEEKFIGPFKKVFKQRG